jgi:hypothetical protein
MCDVFKSSPYFHIGGDEVQWEWFIDRPHVKEYMKKHNMRDKDKGGKDDLLKRHALRMNEIVKKYGKKTIFWGGYQGPPTDPALTDLIMYSWYTGARQALDTGFTIITVPWEIRGPWEKWNIFSCNADMLRRTDSVLGGSRVAWEQDAESYVNGCIYEAIRQEGTWAPDTVSGSMDELRAREKILGERLAKILKTVTIHVATGHEDPSQYGRNPDAGTATITLVAEPPPGCRIRYTTDGSEPTATSPLYEKPVQQIGKLRIRAALFDKSGQVVGGYAFAQKYNWRDFEQNLTTGKPAKSSSFAGQGKDAEVPENAADGWVGNGKAWGADKPPQWWQVDLQNVYALDRVQLFPWGQDGRALQYTVEVSSDEKNWTQVVDESRNTKPVSPHGHLHKFAPVNARYVRVNILKNSAPDIVELEEVRVYEVGKPAPAGSSLQSNTLKADKRYLIFPRAKGVKGADKVFVKVDGELYFAEYDAVLAKSDPDFWTYIDLKLLQGKEVTVSAGGPNAEGIALVRMSDTIPGKYPLYHEPGRPQVHFSPVRGWLNDPSGMFYLNGKWHCYYMNTRFGHYETEFTQMASFPMDLSLRTTPQGPRLFAEFIPELAKLRDGGTSPKDVVVKAAAPLRLGDVSRPLELDLEFEPGAATQVHITGSQLTVRWNATSKELDVHDTKVTLSPQEGRVRLHLLLDIPSVEVVTNGGENYIIKGRHFAELREKSPLEISVEGGDVTFRRLEAYPLKSIQPGAPQ